MHFDEYDKQHYGKTPEIYEAKSVNDDLSGPL